MTILEPKQEKKIFKKIYFFCKMLIFQDFSKFSKILKSAVQYLCRDISNVKIGLYLRSSHKKEWKTHFWPYSLKKSKNWKKETVVHHHFWISFRKKTDFENRTALIRGLASPVLQGKLYICIFYWERCIDICQEKMNYYGKFCSCYNVTTIHN